MKNLYALLLLLAGLGAAPAAAQLYDVRPGDVSYNKSPRAALKVQVDGRASDVRDYFQSWMKSNYDVKFKGGGVLGVGKHAVLLARQMPVSTVSGKLVDLYASFAAPSDSVVEVAVFGGFDDNTFFDPEKTKPEFNALRAMVNGYAGAARTKAYRDLIAEAEQQLKRTEKEKQRLEKNRLSLQANTTMNLARIEDLKKRNVDNGREARADSISLLKNAQVLEQNRLRLQRRRDRLAALDRKN